MFFIQALECLIFTIIILSPNSLVGSSQVNRLSRFFFFFFYYFLFYWLEFYLCDRSCQRAHNAKTGCAVNMKCSFFKYIQIQNLQVLVYIFCSLKVRNVCGIVAHTRGNVLLFVFFFPSFKCVFCLIPSLTLHLPPPPPYTMLFHFLSVLVASLSSIAFCCPCSHVFLSL